MTVSRLPVQHPKQPHCPTCEKDLPTFDGMSMALMDDGEYELLAITFHVRCKCGTSWDLRKAVK